MAKHKNRNNRTNTANSKTHPKQESSTAAAKPSTAQDTTTITREPTDTELLIANVQDRLVEAWEYPETIPTGALYLSFACLAVVIVVVFAAGGTPPV